MKKLVIQVLNVREDRAKVAVDRVVGALRLKFMQKLKRAHKKHPNVVFEKIELEDGFRIVIAGEDSFIDEEYNLFDEGWKGIDEKLGGEKGKTAVLMIGLNLSYWVER